MDPLRIALGTAAALAVAAYTVAKLRRKSASSLSYEQLKRERDASLFGLVFAIFAILLVAPFLNWSFLGQPWTGLLYAVCLGVVYQAARWIIGKLEQPKSTPNAIPEHR